MGPEQVTRGLKPSKLYDDDDDDDDYDDDENDDDDVERKKGLINYHECLPVRPSACPS